MLLLCVFSMTVPPISSIVCAKVAQHTQIRQGTVYVTGDNRRKHGQCFEQFTKGNSGELWGEKNKSVLDRFWGHW